MSPFESRLDPTSSDFERRRDHMRRRIDEVRALEDAIREQSSAKRGKFRARGQWLPRERVGALLDPGAPFLELSKLAGHRTHGEEGGGGGVVTGIGFVRDRRVMIHCSDSAIKGGAVSPMGLKKSLRAQQIALENRLPMVNLIESGGANLLHQAELFVEGGRIFANMARLSAAGIFQITVVHGSSTAGGAYIPGLSDVVVGVRQRSRIFLAGPPLVQAALGEHSNEESLGGAEMHASTTGTVDHLAEDDADGIRMARELVGAWVQPLDSAPYAAPRAPRYDPEELLGVVEPDPRTPYDARELWARVVDDSCFTEFKSGFGSELVCAHARVHGMRCGLVGNNGPIQPDGAAKAGHFIQLCCQAGVPLVYFQNTTGYMVGERAEQAGMVKHGSKMLQAVANATVPQITFLVGGAYGAGNYGMCGRSFDPRFVFAWPNAKISVMGPDQAARVMELITTKKLRRSGEPVEAERLEAMTASVRQTIEAESTALFATARLWDDGIIDPRDTRKVLAFVLATCEESGRRALRPSTFGVARH